MTILLSALHFYALSLGFLGLGIRILSLKDYLSSTGSVGRVYLGDNLWGVAAVLWLITGSLRAFGGYEKGTVYYLSSPWFISKILLFGLIFLLEIYPMVTLIRWRLGGVKALEARYQPIVRRLLVLSKIELFLLFLIPILASTMARGGW